MIPRQTLRQRFRQLLIGPPPRRLEGGTANAGIFLHPGGGLLRRPPRIEKRTNFAREIRLARHLEAAPVSCLPTVFSVRTHEDASAIVMEYVPASGQRHEPTPELVGAILDALCALKAGLAQAPLSAIPTTPSSLLRGIRIEAPELLEQMDARRLTDMFDAFQAMPTSACYNDLSWPNMACRPHAGTCRFIDIGSVCTNVNGAELHHFVRAGQGNIQARAFAEDLIVAYARRLNAEQAAIRYAAGFYAFVRSISRLERQRRSNRTAAHTKERATAATLLARAVELAPA